MKKKLTWNSVEKRNDGSNKNASSNKSGYVKLQVKRFSTHEELNKVGVVQPAKRVQQQVQRRKSEPAKNKEKQETTLTTQITCGGQQFRQFFKPQCFRQKICSFYYE